MPQNPWETAPIAPRRAPGTIFSAPAAPPKPSAGFAPAGAPVEQSYIPGSEADPAYIRQKAQIEAAVTAAAQAGKDIGVKRATAPIELNNDLTKLKFETQLKTDPNNTQKLTPEVRKELINSYTQADQLQRLLDDARNLYKDGPGATKGVAGIQDYLPLTANQRFDAAGNAMRGQIASAMGFTASQNNTEKESQRNVGPYIPQSSDRDATAQDKFARIQEIIDSSRQRAIQQLGGVPDKSGNIMPLDVAKSMGLLPGAGEFTPPPPPGAPPTPTISTGSTKNAIDPKTQQLIDSMIRNGMDADQINKVLVPAGMIGPEGIKQDDIENARKALDAGGTFTITQEKPTTLFNRVSSSSPGAFTIGAADAIAGSNLDSLSGLAGGNPDDVRAKMEGVASAHPTANLLGSIAGGAMDAAGLEFGLGSGAARMGGGILSRIVANPATADAIYGGFYGAGANDKDRLTGAVLGAGSGAIGGEAGRRLARGGGMAFRGVKDEAVRYLHDAGVPMTVGQILGQSGRVGDAARRFENALSSIPGVGSMVRARYGEGMNGFDKAAFDQGLAPINASTNGVIGAAGVDLARAARQQAYSTALDPITLAKDAAFDTGNTAARDAAKLLPKDMADRATYAIDRAAEGFTPQGELSGNAFQQALRRFRRTASENASLPNGADLGSAMNTAEGAYTDLVGRQAPDVLPQLDAANKANRNVSILQDAVNRARNGSRSGEVGTFTASQLNDAAAANARRFGGTQGTTAQPFYELTKAGQQVLPSTLPDSGTTPRLLSALALPALTGGAGATGGYVAGDSGEGAKYGLAAGALASLGASRAAQRMFGRMLLDRPAWARNLADSIAAREPYLGATFAGIGSALSPYLAPTQ